MLRARPKTESIDVLRIAHVEHIDALQTISLPAAAQELDAIFDAVDERAIHLAEALHEMRTGREPQAPREVLERGEELAREHGPLEGARCVLPKNER